MKIDTILGTTKGEYETWADVFKRIDEANGIDVRTLTRVVVAILEELDERPTINRESNGIDSGTRGFEQKDREIQSGDRPIEEEIQPRPTDTSEPILN